MASGSVRVNRPGAMEARTTAPKTIAAMTVAARGRWGLPPPRLRWMRRVRMLPRLVPSVLAGRRKDVDSSVVLS